MSQSFIVALRALALPASAGPGAADGPNSSAAVAQASGPGDWPWSCCARVSENAPAPREVFQAELAVRATRPARWLGRCVGERALGLAMRPAFARAFAGLALLTMAMGFLPDITGTSWDDVSVAQSVTVVGLLSASWLVMFALFLPAFDRSLVLLVARSFDVAFVGANALAFCVLSLWDVNANFAAQGKPVPAFNGYNFPVALYGLAMPCVLFWDALVSPPMRTRLAQVLVMLALILSCLRNLFVERARFTNYSEREICAPYCATVRTLALSALSNTVVFTAKTVVSGIKGRSLQVTFPVHWHAMNDRNFTVLAAELPLRGTLSAAVIRHYIAPASYKGAPLPSNQVEMCTVPRRNLVNWPSVARLARWRWYPLVVLGIQLAFIACELGAVTRFVGVALPLSLIMLAQLAVELTRADAALFAILLRHFETAFVLGNLLIYVVAASVATSSALESDWSVALHAIACFSGAAWVAMVDAMRIPRAIRVAGMTLSLANVVRWLVLELVQPRLDPGPEVCLVFCSRLSSVALGALFNLGVFAAKQLYLAAFTRHLSVICASPTIELTSTAEAGGHHMYSSSSCGAGYESSNSIANMSPPGRAHGSSSVELSVVPVREAALPLQLGGDWEVLLTEGARAAKRFAFARGLELAIAHSKAPLRRRH